MFFGLVLFHIVAYRFNAEPFRIECAETLIFAHHYYSHLPTANVLSVTVAWF